MTSIEVLLLTAVALIIIFAALPYVVNMLYSSMAPLEYRTAVSYILSFADSLEADFGMAGSVKYFPLPKFVLGSFGVVNKTYQLTIECGPSTQRFVWSSFNIWYNSTYFVDVGKLYRGVSSSLFANPGDTLIVVNSTRPGRLRMYPRLFVVEGRDVYIYVINATVKVRPSFNYLSYEIGNVVIREVNNCPHARVSVGGVFKTFNNVGDVYIVVQNADIVLK